MTYRNPLLLLFLIHAICVSRVYSQENNSKNEGSQYALETVEKEKLSFKEIAQRYQELNKSDSAQFYVKKAIAQSKDISPKEQAALKGLQAEIYYTSGNFKDGLKAINESLKIHQGNSLPRNNDYARYVFRQGAIYFVLNENKSALKSLKEASKTVNNNNLKAQILSTLSDLYFKLGDEEGALDAATELTQKPLVETISPLYIAKSYNIAANVYRKNKDFDKAIVQEHKAIDLYKQNDYAMGVAASLVNISDDYNKSGRYTKSLETLDNASAENLGLNNTYINAAISLNKAESLTRLGNYTEAYILYDKSLEQFQKLTIPSGAAEALLGKSKALYDEQKLEASEQAVKASLDLAQKNGLLDIEEQGYFTLYRIYKKKQGTSQALTYHEKYATLKDSISTREKQTSINNLKIRFDVQRLENELSLKNKELVLSDEKEKSSRYLKILLSLGILSLLLLIYRLYKIIKTRSIISESEKKLAETNRLRLRKEIDFKKQEVTNFALQISDRNETLTKLAQKINTVSKSADTDTKKQLRNITNAINNAIQVNQEKVALYSKIDEAKNDFYLTIKEKYPALSSREIEIASYLRLNLGSKQIASQFNISHQSVNNYRSKIRKKLGLDASENLIDFLQKL